MLSFYIVEARDVCMYILRMHTGLKNKEIGDVFGVGISAVNKASLRVNEQIDTHKNIKNKVQMVAYSIFKV